MSLIVGQFNDSYEPLMDETARVTKQYAYWLRQNACDSYIVTPFHPGSRTMDEVQILHYNSIPSLARYPYRLGIPNFDNNFNKKINNINFDLVHAHCPYSSGQLALKIARKRNIPVIATFHFKYFNEAKNITNPEGLSQFFRKRIVDFYSKVDFVWAPNKYAADMLKNYGYKGEVDIIKNGTDFNPLYDSNELCEKINRKFCLEKDELLFLFVGHQVWEKNLKMLIRALNYLKKMGLKYKMIFVGSGYAENELKKLSVILNLDGYIQFAGQISDRELIKSLFTRTNLFLFPALHDSSPAVIQEAAAMSCPTLAIEGSKASEGIKDCYNGYLCEDDAEIYASKIKNIVSNPEVLKCVGKNAQSTLYKNWREVLEVVKNKYEIIIANYKNTRDIG